MYNNPRRISKEPMDSPSSIVTSDESYALILEEESSQPTSSEISIEDATNSQFRHVCRNQLLQNFVTRPQEEQPQATIYESDTINKRSQLDFEKAAVAAYRKKLKLLKYTLKELNKEMYIGGTIRDEAAYGSSMVKAEEAWEKEIQGMKQDTISYAQMRKRTQEWATKAKMKNALYTQYNERMDPRMLQMKNLTTASIQAYRIAKTDAKKVVKSTNMIRQERLDRLGERVNSVNTIQGHVDDEITSYTHFKGKEEKNKKKRDALQASADANFKKASEMTLQKTSYYISIGKLVSDIHKIEEWFGCTDADLIVDQFFTAKSCSSSKNNELESLLYERSKSEKKLADLKAHLTKMQSNLYADNSKALFLEIDKALTSGVNDPLISAINMWKAYESRCRRFEELARTVYLSLVNINEKFNNFDVQEISGPSLEFGIKNFDHRSKDLLKPEISQMTSEFYILALSLTKKILTIDKIAKTRRYWFVTKPGFSNDLLKDLYAPTDNVLLKRRTVRGQEQRSGVPERQGKHYTVFNRNFLAPTEFMKSKERRSQYMIAQLYKGYMDIQRAATLCSADIPQSKKTSPRKSLDDELDLYILSQREAAEQAEEHREFQQSRGDQHSENARKLAHQKVFRLSQRQENVIKIKKSSNRLAAAQIQTKTPTKIQKALNDLDRNMYNLAAQTHKMIRKTLSTDALMFELKRNEANVLKYGNKQIPQIPISSSRKSISRPSGTASTRQFTTYDSRGSTKKTSHTPLRHTRTASHTARNSIQRKSSRNSLASVHSTMKNRLSMSPGIFGTNPLFTVTTPEKTIKRSRKGKASRKSIS